MSTALEEGGAVLVNCIWGKSRSVVCVVAFLMWASHIYVQKRRPVDRVSCNSFEGDAENEQGLTIHPPTPLFFSGGLTCYLHTPASLNLAFLVITTLCIFVLLRHCSTYD